MTQSEILTQLDSLGDDVDHVIITGGEPMLWEELVELTANLKLRGKHITIETSGTIDRNVTCDLMSISPKLACTLPRLQGPHWIRRHEATRHAPPIIDRLTRDYDYQLKFVIDSPSDCEEVESYLVEFPHVTRDRVLLMPQGVTQKELTKRGDWLAPYCKSADLTFCPRRHIEWYGSKRGV